MSSLVVLNPEASTARRSLHRVRAALADSALLRDMEVVPSTGWDEGRAAAAEAARGGFDLVVAAGGDGTVNSVLNGLMETEPPRPVLAVLPLGTGNDLARSLGIPGDLEGAMEELERRIVRKMDVIQVTLEGVRYGANVCAGGFSGRAEEDLDDQTKESWGPLSYLRAALAHLPELASYEVTLAAEDETVELSVLNLVVANARYAAAGVPVAPGARLDDGKLDVVAVSSAPLARVGIVVARMAAGRHLEHELVTFLRTPSLRVESTPEMAWNVDGELVGKGPARFEVLPGAVRVLVGGDRQGAI